MKIGIDIGSSAIKIAVLEEDKLKLVKTIENSKGDAVVVITEYLKASGVLEKQPEGIYTTGVGSKDIRQPLCGYATYRADEFQATGEGVRFLTGHKDVIVVSMGTGSFFAKVTETETAHLGGVGLGGGTIRGLSSLLLGTTDATEILALAEQGSVAKVDMRLGDKVDEQLSGMNLDVTLSNFGKASADSAKEDVAAGLVHMVLENICQSAILSSVRTGIKDYVLIGGLTNFPECGRLTSAFKSLWGDIELTIPEYAEYATAIGAMQLTNAVKIEI